MTYFLRSFFYLSLIFSVILQVQPAFKFSTANSGIRLSGASARLALATSITGFDGLLEITNKSATSITRAATETIGFAKGVYKSGTTESLLTGTLDPNTTDTITLDTGQSLETESGSFVESLIVKGAGNVVRGKPVFGSAITLFNSTAELQIGIQTPLTQSITLNGGTVKLLDNLELQDGVLFSGTGTIDVNNKRLILPAVQGSPWTATLDILNGNDVSLTGKTVLNGTLNFTGSGASTNYNGNGNILDVSGTGVLRVRNGHTLYLTDIHIKGVKAGTFVLDTATSVIRFSNVTLELGGNPTITQGTWRFEGDQCNIIAPNANKILVNTGGTFIVDGIALLYDPLGTAPVNPSPIDNSGGGTLTLSNNAVIRSNFGGGGVAGSTTVAGTSGTLSSTFFLSAGATMAFTNAVVGTPKAISYDGQGNSLYFNYSTGQNMVVGENVTLTMTNIALKGFDPALINFQGAGATKGKIVFGDNVSVELSKNISVISTDNPLAFNGNATLNGFGNTISLTGTGRLTVDGAGKTLTIKGARIYTSAVDSITVNTATTTLQLQGMNLHATSAGLNFPTGNIKFLDDVLISGRSALAPNGSSSFNFTSGGLATVLSQSKLKLDKNTQFFYNPSITGDGGVVAVQKRHIVFTDPSSVLDMDGATFKVGTMGVAMDYGQLNIDGKATLDINASGSFDLGSAVDVQVAPGAILDVNGIVNYAATTYP